MTEVPKSPTSSKVVTTSPPHLPSLHPQQSAPTSPFSPLQPELKDESDRKEITQHQQPLQQEPQTKQRKPQTAEEFAHQLDLWRASGLDQHRNLALRRCRKAQSYRKQSR